MAHQIADMEFMKSRSNWVALIKQNTRKVNSYNKANWSDFKKNLAIFTNMFTKYTHKDPNHLWNMFKAEVKRLSNPHIPTRQINSRADLPWVTREIVKLIRKRDKLYTRLKRSSSHKSHYTEKLYFKSTKQNSLEMHTGHT